jgi:hypothetical protein
MLDDHGGNRNGRCGGGNSAGGHAPGNKSTANRNFDNGGDQYFSASPTLPVILGAV